MEKIPGWFQKCARMMVQEHFTFQAAISELGLGLSMSESAKSERSREFKRILQGEKDKYYQELGDSPTWTKHTLVGEMRWCAAQLVREGMFDKAAEVLFKIARIEGHVGGETVVSTVFGVTQKEIEEAKKGLKLVESKEIGQISPPKSLLN